MVCPLHQFLVGILPQQPTEEVDPNAKFRWIAQDGGGINYEQWDELSESTSLEKIFSLMNAQFKNYKELTILTHQEKTNLWALRKLVLDKTQSYQNSHEGFCGWIYLIFKGLFNGGHIEDVSEKVLKKINALTKKPSSPPPPDIRNINVFLNLVAPLRDLQSMFSVSLLDEPMGTMWVYDENTNVIQDKEFKLSEISREVDPEVVAKMNEQLDAFEDLADLTIIQREQLERLSNMVEQRLSNHQEISEKIANLLKKPESLPPSDEKIEKMNKTSIKLFNEILTTEKTFQIAITRAIELIKHLKTLSEDETVLCDPEFEKFFRSVETDDDDEKLQGYLTKCLAAYENLQACIVPFLADLEFCPVDDIELRNKALFQVYTSAEFKAYSKATATAARYYNVLCDLDRNLKQRNEEDGPVALYFKDEQQVLRQPTYDYIVAVQRPMRHVSLLTDLLEKTPPNSDSYRSVLLAYISAYSYSCNVDIRADFMFKL